MVRWQSIVACRARARDWKPRERGACFVASAEPTATAFYGGIRRGGLRGDSQRPPGRSGSSCAMNRYFDGRTVVRFETMLKKRNTFSICAAPRRIQNS
jgi:hypothetical protein